MEKYTFMSISSCLHFTLEELVIKAEILHALKIVSNDHSFRSTRSDPKLSRKMFPDSKICESFHKEKLK